MEEDYEQLLSQARQRLAGGKQLGLPVGRKLLEVIDLYKFSPMIHTTLDLRGRILNCNRTTTEVLQVPRDKLIGRALYTFLVPGWRDTLHLHLRDVIEKQERQSCELMLCPDHRHAWHYVRADSRWDEAARGGGVLRTSLTDITKQKEVESELRRRREELQMTTNAGGIGIWDADLVRGTVNWNDKLYELLGLKPRPGPEDVETFFGFIHPGDRCQQLTNSTEAAKEDDLFEEFRIIRADGQLRWLAIRGRVYRDAEGHPVRMSGVNYDITERKQIEQQLARSRAQLVEQLAEVKRVNAELSEYTYAVSHDLKAPLRAIHNYVDFISQDLVECLSDESRSHLAGLKRAAEQGNSLIGDLLAFSRIGRVQLDYVPQAIPAMVNDIIALLPQKPTLEIDIVDDFPEIITDPLLLRQIFQNLIDNAVKFNTSNPEHIEVGWQPVGSQRIEIFVRDNGIGIDTIYHEQIFRVFQRLHSDKEYSGTGIGLAIVRKAATQLGGSVRVDSKPGHGSTFYVNLPLVLEREEDET